MTDAEMIARLRDEHISVTGRAADRIEQLVHETSLHETTISMINTAWDQALQQRDDAEARLAKAVEALERIEGQAFRKARATARAVLARVKG